MKDASVPNPVQVITVVAEDLVHFAPLSASATIAQIQRFKSLKIWLRRFIKNVLEKKTNWLSVKKMFKKTNFKWFINDSKKKDTSPKNMPLGKNNYKSKF
jgi:hypothetical protein